MRFRFTLRHLLVTIAVVGLALGWWSDRQRMAEYRAKVSLVIAHKLNIPEYMVERTIDGYHAELIQQGFKPLLEEEELSAPVAQP